MNSSIEPGLSVRLRRTHEQKAVKRPLFSVPRPVKFGPKLVIAVQPWKLRGFLTEFGFEPNNSKG